MIDRRSIKVFLLLAIVFQLVQRLIYFSVGEDISIQLNATKNFVAGKGITISEVLENDLSTIVSRSVSEWPVGYSLLLTPIYKLVDNIMWSAMILDAIFIALFIFLIYRLMIQIKVADKVLSLIHI